MLPIDYLPGARRDFDEPFDWYAERSPEAAVRFAAAIDAALDRIVATATQVADLKDAHREWPLFVLASDKSRSPTGVPNG